MMGLKENTSERYLQLCRWRSYFDNTQHDHKEVSWNNTQANDSLVDLYNNQLQNTEVEHEVKLDNKRPDAPENLGEVIVSTFTDLLFDEDSKPSVVSSKSESDKKWDEWYRNFITVTDFFEEWAECRNIAGSMSSALISLEFDSGIPFIKCYESRYVIPTFLSAGKKYRDELESVLIRYVYESEEIVQIEAHDAGMGLFTGYKKEQRVETVKRWYQRKITRDADITYDNPKYVENRSPEFTEKRNFEHGFGIVPALWIRNGPRVGIDSITDYDGAFGLLDKLDMISSMIARTALYNGDPTVHVADDANSNVVKTGSFAFINTSSKGSAKFVEISGTSIDAMIKSSKQLRESALRKCRCVIDVDGVSGRDRVTATEISSSMKRMYVKASKLRERFGTYMTMFLRMAADCCSKLSEHPNDGAYDVSEYSVADDFYTPDKNPITPKLKWGKFVNMSTVEMKTLADAISILTQSSVVDKMTAIEMIAQHVSSRSAEEIYNLVMAETKAEDDADDGEIDTVDKEEDDIGA